MRTSAASHAARGESPGTRARRARHALSRLTRLPHPQCLEAKTRHDAQEEMKDPRILALTTSMLGFQMTPFKGSF